MPPGLAPPERMPAQCSFRPSEVVIMRRDKRRALQARRRSKSFWCWCAEPIPPAAPGQIAVQYCEPPAPIGRFQMRPAAPVQLRPVSMDPTPHTTRADGQASFSGHLPHLSHRDGVPEIAAHTPHDNVAWIVSPFERIACGGARRTLAEPAPGFSQRQAAIDPSKAKSVNVLFSPSGPVRPLINQF